MLMGSNLYFDIIFLVTLFTFYMPFWVFCTLGYKLSFGGMSQLRGESDTLEFFWTVMPTISVTFLCYLNLLFLCGNGGMLPGGDIIKVMGRQWYWSYECDDGSVYDSLMGDFLNVVDKPLRVVYGRPCKFLVTSSDVMHSFSLPDVGIKIDAIPGRVNHLLYMPDHIGVQVGYCTELCGAGHAYMPVMVEVVRNTILGR